MGDERKLGMKLGPQLLRLPGHEGQALVQLLDGDSAIRSDALEVAPHNHLLVVAEVNSCKATNAVIGLLRTGISRLDGQPFLGGGGRPFWSLRSAPAPTSGGSVGSRPHVAL